MPAHDTAQLVDHTLLTSKAKQAGSPAGPAAAARPVLKGHGTPHHVTRKPHSLTLCQHCANQAVPVQASAAACHLQLGGR